MILENYINKNIVFLCKEKNIPFNRLISNKIISMEMLHRAKRGNNLEKMTIKTIMKLAAFFEVSLDEFVLTDLEKQKKKKV